MKRLEGRSMGEAERFQIVAETLRAEADRPGALAQRARMVILAEHFERLARVAKNEPDWTEPSELDGYYEAGEHC